MTTDDQRPVTIVRLAVRGRLPVITEREVFTQAERRMCAAATIMSLAAMVASILYFVLDRDLTTAAGFAGIGATCLAQRNLTASNAWRAAYVGAASIVAAVVVPDLDLERLRREGN